MPVSKKHSAEEYLSYGFTTVIERGKIMPQCVLCGRIFSAFSLKPSKMIRHMECRHPESKNSSIDFFRQQYEKIKANGPYQSFTYENQNHNFTKNVQILPKTAMPSMNGNAAVMSKRRHITNIAGLKLSYRLAQQKCRPSLAQDLMLPVFRDLVGFLSPSNNDQTLKEGMKNIVADEKSVKQNISCLSLDVREQTVDCLKKSVLFSLLIDETSDIERGEHIIISIRYLSNQIIVDDFLLGEPIPSDLSGEDIFEKIDDFFTSEGLTWLNCVSVTISGSPVFTYFKEAAEARNPDILVLNSFIDRPSLFSLEYSTELNEAIENSMKAVNLIKTFQRRTFLFKSITDNLSLENKLLLDNSTRRWVMSGELFLRLLEFRDETKTALTNMGEIKLAEQFEDFRFIGLMYFICDVLDRIYRIQNSFEDKANNILEMSILMSQFEKKLVQESEEDVLDVDQYSNYTYYSNKILQNVENREEILANNKAIIGEYLKKLAKGLSAYRVDLLSTMWIKKPDDFEMTSVPEKSAGLRVDLSTMLSNESSVVKEELKEYPLPEFWIRRLANFPSAGLEALRVLLSFYSISPNHKAIMTLIELKRNMTDLVQNDFEHEIRLCLGKNEPRFDQIITSNPTLFLKEEDLNIDKNSDALPPLAKLVKLEEPSTNQSHSSSSSENGLNLNPSVSTNGNNFILTTQNSVISTSGGPANLANCIIAQAIAPNNKNGVKTTNSISTNPSINIMNGSLNTSTNGQNHQNDFQTSFPNLLGVTQFPGLSLDLLGVLNTSLSM